MRNATLATLLAAVLTGLAGAGPAMAGTSPAQEAGATAGLAVACDPTDPDLREFIRQSMAAIEVRSRSAEELERNRRRTSPARCTWATP